MVTASPGKEPGNQIPSLESLIASYIKLRGALYFVQVGSFDGVVADPLFPSVVKFSLSGCLIEPQKDAFERLRSNYAAAGRHTCVFVNAAIGAYDGTATLYRVKPGATTGPEWMHQLASFNRDVLLSHAPHIPNLDALVIAESVPCLTFDTVLKQEQIQNVDLLQIDTEGSDALILRLFDVPRRKPAIVGFEHKHLTAAVYTECVTLLSGAGYQVGIHAERKDDTVAFLRSAFGVKAFLRSLPRRLLDRWSI